MAHAGKKVRLCRIGLFSGNQRGSKLLLLPLFPPRDVRHIGTRDTYSSQLFADIKRLISFNPHRSVVLFQFEYKAVGILIFKLFFHVSKIHLGQILFPRRFIHAPVRYIPERLQVFALFGDRIGQPMFEVDNPPAAFNHINLCNGIIIQGSDCT